MQIIANPSLDICTPQMDFWHIVLVLIKGLNTSQNVIQYMHANTKYPIYGTLLSKGMKILNELFIIIGYILVFSYVLLQYALLYAVYIRLNPGAVMFTCHRHKTNRSIHCSYLDILWQML